MLQLKMYKLPDDLTPLVWIVDPPAEDNMLKLSYSVSKAATSDLVLQQLANDNTVIGTVLIPRNLILSLSIELSKFLSSTQKPTQV